MEKSVNREKLCVLPLRTYDFRCKVYLPYVFFALYVGPRKPLALKTKHIRGFVLAAGSPIYGAHLRVTQNMKLNRNIVLMENMKSVHKYLLY